MAIDETDKEKYVLIGLEIWDAIKKLDLDKRSPTELSDEERKGFLIIPPIEDRLADDESIVE
jgi:hypothetical protein